MKPFRKTKSTTNGCNSRCVNTRVSDSTSVNLKVISGKKLSKNRSTAYTYAV